MAPESGDLLNLPLATPGDDAARVEVQESLPLEPLPNPAVIPPARAMAAAAASIRARRLWAGLTDFGVTAASLFVAGVGAWVLGARLTPSTAPAFLLFTASFSFLYLVVPLMFWGQSPGMATFSLVARTADGAPLTLQQAVARWAGAALTVLGIGLPLLVLLHSERSLADRLSGSRLSDAPA